MYFLCIIRVRKRGEGTAVFGVVNCKWHRQYITYQVLYSLLFLWQIGTIQSKITLDKGPSLSLKVMTISGVTMLMLIGHFQRIFGFVLAFYRVSQQVWNRQKRKTRFILSVFQTCWDTLYTKSSDGKPKIFGNSQEEQFPGWLASNVIKGVAFTIWVVVEACSKAFKPYHTHHLTIFTLLASFKALHSRSRAKRASACSRFMILL